VTVRKIRKPSGEERHRRVRGAQAVRPKVCWQLQTAKAQFSELARRATQPASLVRFFAESPLVGVGLDLTRRPDYGRDVEL
jgi:hypothetical protein